MLSRTTKEAIKVGLSIAISLLTALWLGWDKVYWSAITVFMLATTETYSHAIKKAQTRLLGSLLGVGYAFLLLGLFAQNHFLFLVFFTALLALCAFMGTHKSVGYAFMMCFNVCAIIACMGLFDSATTFNIAMLRIKENLLGILVYSLVYSLVWPKKAEDDFFELVDSIFDNLKQRYSQLTVSQNEASAGNHYPLQSTRSDLAEQTLYINKLKEILTLPLNQSYRLKYEKSRWRVIVEAMTKLEFTIAKLEQGDTDKREAAAEGIKRLSEALYSPTSPTHQLQHWVDQNESWGVFRQPAESAFGMPLAQRIRNTVKAVCIFLTCMALWVYVPIPGGYMVPLIAAIFANAIASVPDSAVKNVASALAIWGTLFLSQYIFIMPSLTEAWQLALIYFIDGFIIWILCSKPQHALHQLLAANLSVIMCLGALQRTPTYDIMNSLTMLTMIAVCLAIITFYTKLFSKG